MSHLLRLCGFVAALLVACGEPPSFRPYSASGVGQPPLTAEAVELYPGDYDAFLQCRFERLGDYVFYEETHDGRTPGHYAAARGGTHIRLLDVESYETGGGGAVISQFGNVAIAQSTAETHTNWLWRVYRVRPEDMGCLPEPMRPASLAEGAVEQQPSCAGCVLSASGD